jgi:hypothetical protein
MSEPTTTITDVTKTVDAYLAMWNEQDADRRAALVREAWAEDGRYVDPLIEAAGHAQLHAMVDGVHAQFPGQRFRRRSAVDAHHEVVRFAWDLSAADGTVTVAGIDVGVIGDDGRFVAIAGFFGDLQPVD